MRYFLHELVRGSFRIFIRLTIAINTLFLMTTLRQCTIVHGDGPNGFGELLTKGLMAQFSITVFVFAMTSARTALKSTAKENRSIYAVIVTTLLLALIFSLSVHDACSNDKGYCKDGRMAFTFWPDNSFKQIPHPGVGLVPALG